MTTRTRLLLLDKPCLASQALAQVAPEDPDAIREGRLFADRRRIAEANEPLRDGQVVAWYAPRATTMVGDTALDLVIDRIEGFIAAAKPAAWSCEPDRTGSVTSLRERLQQVLGVKELHVATRLDVGVSGLVLAAVDPASRRHLTQSITAGNCHRSYVGILLGRLPDRGRWQSPIEVKSHGSRVSVTNFESMARLTLDPGVTLGPVPSPREVTLVMLRPETGHRHQLRIHAARAGAPMLGDRRYGGSHRLVDATGRVTTIERICLHAVATYLPLPDGTPWRPECALAQDFLTFWQQLGGNARDLEGIRP